MVNPIRILLLDDHGLFRESLARLLSSEPDFSVVGHCALIDEALATLARTEVDLILLDYDLGDEFGTNILASLAVLKPVPRILIVTAGIPERATYDALAAGARGIVLKHSGPQHLIEVIRKTVKSDAADTKSLVRLPFLQSDEPKLDLSPERPLTKRQSKALRGILDGLRNREIAVLMNVSESAVKAILQELFDKAGVRTRSQLVRIAIENNRGAWIRANS